MDQVLKLSRLSRLAIINFDSFCPGPGRPRVAPDVAVPGIGVSSQGAGRSCAREGEELERGAQVGGESGGHKPGGVDGHFPRVRQAHTGAGRFAKFVDRALAQVNRVG
jgi:hypothetical protein